MKRVVPSAYPEQPPHYWAVMTQLTRDAGGFTVRDVHDRTNGPRRAVVKEYIRRCRKLGVIKPVGSRDVAIVYAVRLDITEAPVVRRPDFAADRGRRIQHLWRAIRLMSSFTIAELIATASTDQLEIDPRIARKYVLALSRAGYVTEAGRRTRVGQAAVWRLLPVRNTGPLAPALTQAGVVDRNVGQHRAAPLRSIGRAA